MNLIFLGAPGSGKGTQAEVLEKTLGLAKLSTGDMLRAAVKAGTPAGKKAASIMEAGGLVSDDIVISMIEERICQPDCAGGFILDGFPRTLAQAQALATTLKQLNKKIDKVIEFAVNEQILVERVSGRYSCAQCGSGYHDTFKQPAKQGICDNCGHTEFTRRKDDNATTIKERLKAYNQQTAPLLPYYKEQNLLYTLDAMQEILQVTKLLQDLVKK